jgi:hypothetical protein
LCGPEDYSPQDIARTLASLLGRDVGVDQIPLTAAVPTFKRFGFSEDAARLYGEMSAGINSGRVAFERDSGELRRGTVRPAQVFEGLLQTAQAKTA